MPFTPELFSAPVLERLEAQGRHELASVPYFDAHSRRVDFPVAIVADRRSDGLIDELRIYFSNWPLAGRHAHRPPLCSPIRSCVHQTSLPTTNVRSRRATSTRLWRHSNPTATPVGPLAGGTYTGVETACARSTICCSRTVAVSRLSTAQ